MLLSTLDTRVARRHGGAAAGAGGVAGSRFQECGRADGWRRPLRSVRRRMRQSIRSAPTSPVSIWHAPLIALSTGNVVVFWLFTRALFDDAFKLRGLAWRWSGRRSPTFSFVNCMLDCAGVGQRAVVHRRDQPAWCSASLRWRWRRPLPRGRLIWSRAAAASRVFIVSRRCAAMAASMRCCRYCMSGSGTTEIAEHGAMPPLLAGIVAAICYAMMRVDGADLFPAAPEVAPAAIVHAPSLRADARRPESWSTR